MTMNSPQKKVRAAKVGLLLCAAPFALALPTRAQDAPPDFGAFGTATLKPGGDTKQGEVYNSATDSLAAMLAKARLGRMGLALAVDAWNSGMMRKGYDRDSADTVGRAAAAYGMTLRDFGGVAAIGPETYVELLTDFSKGNAFEDLPPAQAFTLLLTTLDERQRAALTSKAGLGLSDLTTPEQNQIFLSLLPDENSYATPQRLDVRGEAKKLGNLRQNANTVHFRLTQEISFAVEMKGLKGRFDSSAMGKEYEALYDFPPTRRDASGNDKVNGVAIRRDVPNQLKPADLNYNAPALQVLIPITDLKTVGDLIARIAQQTRIELYCDPHYEKQRLTWVASGVAAASASELLRAVAFCAAGTYRKVGTAFVLTEDLQGVGTRRRMIQDFEDECDAQRQKALREGIAKFTASSAPKSLKLSGFDDPMALSAEQEKEWQKPKAAVTDFFNHQLLDEESFPFEKLTSTQQAAIRDWEAYEKKVQERDKGTEWGKYQPDFDQNVHVQRSFSAQMLINGKYAASTEYSHDLGPLFAPHSAASAIPSAWKKAMRGASAWPDPVKSLPRRAVICKPYTKAEVDASLARIAALGFNQMWLVVFEKGRARIPGTGFPLDPACDPKVDILAYAIAEGKKKGLTVCPVVDVLAWGMDAPKDACLLTLRGEDSAQSARRRFRVDALTASPEAQWVAPAKKAALSAALYVDPTLPETQKALTGLFQALSAHAGIQDYVCLNLNPPGFARDSSFIEGDAPSHRDGMGYNTGLRLAFLRKYHFDPIDVPEPKVSRSKGRANVSLTNYTTDDEIEAWGPNRPLEAWEKFRAKSLQTALHSLFAPLFADSGAGKPRLLIARDAFGATSRFDVFTDLKAPFPVNSLFLFPAETPNGKRIAAAPLSNIHLLSKQPTPPLLLFCSVSWGYGELRKLDWIGVQTKFLEESQKSKLLDGIVIEE